VREGGRKGRRKGERKEGKEKDPCNEQSKIAHTTKFKSHSNLSHLTYINTMRSIFGSYRR